MITVLIAYDGSLSHFAATTPVQSGPDLWVIGTVTNDLGVIPALHILEPDVLVFESMQSSLRAIQATQYVTARALHTRVVIVSTQVEQVSLIRALRSGVAAIVLRPFDRTELVHAVREAAAGRYYLSPKLWRALEGYAERMCDTAATRAKLTAVEYRLLELFAAGHDMSEITARLSLTRATVEAYRQTLMRKLGLRTQTDLAVYALCWGVAAAQQRSAIGSEERLGHG